MDTILPTHPEPYHLLIKRSLILYVRGFKKAFIFSLLLSLVVFLPRIISDIVGYDIFLGLPRMNPNRLWLFLIEITAMLFSIAIYWHMYCVVRDVDEPLAEDFMRGLKKVLHVLIGTILQGIFLLAVSIIIYAFLYLLFRYHFLTFEASSYLNSPGRTLLLIFVLIGQLLLILYVATLFIFLVPLIVIENKGIINALIKSVLLVWNEWWRTFSVQATPWLFYLISMLVIRFIFSVNIHFYFFPQGPHPVWTTPLHIILFGLFVPWIASVAIVQLRDLELRKEIHHKLHEAKLKHSHT